MINIWEQVVEEALASHEIGVISPDDTYETARKKLNLLLTVNQDIGKFYESQKCIKTQKN